MNLKDMKLSEIIQSQRDKYCMIPLFVEKVQHVLPRAKMRCNKELVLNGYRYSVWKNGEN